MTMTTDMKSLLHDSLENIGRLGLSKADSNDEGMLCDQARRIIFEQIRGETRNEEHFKLVITRLATLCAQTMRPFLLATDAAHQTARAVLDALSSYVDKGDLLSIKRLTKSADELFETANRVELLNNKWPVLKEEPKQQAQYALITIAQAVKLAAGGIDDDQMHAYQNRVGPDLWMPEFWASIASADGLPKFPESMTHKMRHFWVWYLETGIPLALDLFHPTSEPRFTPPPQIPPKELKRFESPRAQKKMPNPLTTRVSFLDGYVEKTVNKRGRTVLMKFMCDGSSSGKLWVDYRARTGSYSDEMYCAQNYRSGYAEDVHLSCLANTEENIPIDEWVANMEAQLLKDIISRRFGRLLAWADAHWEKPLQPKLHQDDLRLCLDSVERTFEADNVTLETARPYHQIMWCFCAFALDEQVERARAIFYGVWEQDGHFFKECEHAFLAMAARHS